MEDGVSELKHFTDESQVEADGASSIEQGVAPILDTEVMCIDHHVTEDNTRDDAALLQAEIEPLSNVEESKDEAEEALSLIHQGNHVQQLDTSYTPLDISNTPIMIAHATADFIGQKSNNFLKGCKWAPDGSCILTCSDDNLLRIFNLPASLYSNASQRCDEELQSVRWIKEGETVYDYCWYPLMTSFDAATCCVAATGRDGPVHLWNVFTGDLCCTYTPHNHLDELISANSLGFTRDGSHLLCGFPKCIRVFPTASPGKQCRMIPTVVDKCKFGQSGIISCFAFHPSDEDIFAAGSYTGSVGIYSLSTGTLQFLVEGHSGGITHLVFSADGNYLYSGGRKDPNIICWDIRNPGKALIRMRRNVETNQRMYFDLDSANQYLVSGNHSGKVSMWDTRQSNDEAVLNTSLSFQAHKDCVNGISIHPVLPVIATASGQRKFPLSSLNHSSSSDEDSDCYENDSVQDNCLKLWSLASQQYSIDLTEENCT